MATTEERLGTLESGVQEALHRIDAGLGANALGVNLVHADTQAIKGELTQFRAEVRGELDDIKTTLAEVLRRLPESPV